MRARRAIRRTIAAFALAWLSAWLSVWLGACVSGPPPTHALTVRHLEHKCALIAFSGCAALRPPDEGTAEDLDAGVE